jgi:hypothetical protein
MFLIPNIKENSELILADRILLENDIDKLSILGDKLNNKRIIY